MDGANTAHDDEIAIALEHLRSALHLLDSAEAPPQIGARLDHIIHDVYMTMAADVAGTSLNQIDRNAAAQ